MPDEMRVLSVNVSERKGTAKRPVDSVEIDRMGVVGDAHAGPGVRQVSLLGQLSIDRFSDRTGRRIRPGEFAENVTVSGTDFSQVAWLDGFRIGRAELEVTQIGKACHGSRCTIFEAVGDCVMPKEGLFCRVIRGGAVHPGDTVQHVVRELRFRVITVSDRAAAGHYADASGPKVRALLGQFLAPRRWHGKIDAMILPDERKPLRKALAEARDGGVDVVFTTGGTGAGPRDVTPEAAAEVCDRLLPGIMEHVRVKFGSQNPRALLSRGIAGLAGQMQIYTLPGSVRAVEEYMGEILKTLEHVIFMVHGLDVHDTGTSQ